MDKETTLQELKDIVRTYRDERDWEQFHDPKNLAMSLAVEAGELQELFLWRERAEVAELLATDADFRKRVEDELSDVLFNCMSMANTLGVDLAINFKRKVEQSAKRYPADVVKGSAGKYHEIKRAKNSE